MRVLVIPEDSRRDQYVLKPIITAMMTALGQPRAKVQICSDPIMQGVSEALKWPRIQLILEQYRGMVDLFLLCVDRDGDVNRRASLDYIEQQARVAVPAGRLLLAENAWQEVEVWVLAGHELPSDWAWQTIRSEVNPKEVYFEPFARTRGVDGNPDGGRKILAEEAARRYDRIRRLCPEDVAALENRIRADFSTGP